MSEYKSTENRSDYFPKIGSSQRCFYYVSNQSLNDTILDKPDTRDHNLQQRDEYATILPRFQNAYSYVLDSYLLKQLQAFQQQLRTSYNELTFQEDRLKTDQTIPNISKQVQQEIQVQLYELQQQRDQLKEEEIAFQNQQEYKRKQTEDFGYQIHGNFLSKYSEKDESGTPELSDRCRQKFEMVQNKYRESFRMIAQSIKGKLFTTFNQVAKDQLIQYKSIDYRIIKDGSVIFEHEAGGISSKTRPLFPFHYDLTEYICYPEETSKLSSLKLNPFQLKPFMFLPIANSNLIEIDLTNNVIRYNPASTDDWFEEPLDRYIEMAMLVTNQRMQYQNKWDHFSGIEQLVDAYSEFQSRQRYTLEEDKLYQQVISQMNEEGDDTLILVYILAFQMGLVIHPYVENSGEFELSCNMSAAEAMALLRHDALIQSLPVETTDFPFLYKLYSNQFPFFQQAYLETGSRGLIYQMFLRRGIGLSYNQSKLQYAILQDQNESNAYDDIYMGSDVEKIKKGIQEILDTIYDNLNDYNVGANIDVLQERDYIQNSIQSVNGEYLRQIAEIFAQYFQMYMRVQYNSDKDLGNLRETLSQLRNCIQAQPLQVLKSVSEVLKHYAKQYQQAQYRNYGNLQVQTFGKEMENEYDIKSRICVPKSNNMFLAHSFGTIRQSFNKNDIYFEKLYSQQSDQWVIHSPGSAVSNVTYRQYKLFNIFLAVHVGPFYRDHMLIENEAFDQHDEKYVLIQAPRSADVNSNMLTELSKSSSLKYSVVKNILHQTPLYVSHKHLQTPNAQ